ncbi:hypothetical protein WR25_00868 [Diploscapter pachys]|uniref:Uncharacterized protein n=1 Tax=Diploscapter pachys TaxID=2018661 RepID=A0A2A2M628_9BILA|nr:hypothetical protein WR25_00868 [Diploscapter pachys]
MRARSIAQVGLPQFQALVPCGDAVLPDLPRLQRQARAALVFDTRGATGHLPGEQAQAYVDRARWQIPISQLLATSRRSREIISTL